MCMKVSGRTITLLIVRWPGVVMRQVLIRQVSTRTWSSNALKTISRKLVSNLLGHREETNARFYDYDTSSFAQKKEAKALLIQHFRPFSTK